MLARAGQIGPGAGQRLFGAGKQPGGEDVELCPSRRRKALFQPTGHAFCRVREHNQPHPAGQKLRGQL